jgi:pimeloyl-ACP methyl ester carboxylesterase
MRKRNRVTLGLALTAALVLFGGTSIANGAPPRIDPEIDWHACAEQPVDPSVQCATLDLPIDWSQPSGAKFPLAIAERKATDPKRRAGVLELHAGGPGISGVEAVEDPTYFSSDVRNHFDIVGFDPRGVGRTEPITCSPDLLAKQPNPIPNTVQAYEQLVAYNHTLYDDCRTRTGPVFDHVDSLSVARDVDAIRVALGEKKISFYGVSYGSMVGQAYAENFSRNLRVMALDSPLDHTRTARQFMTEEAAGGEATLLQFADWCDRVAGCSLHGRNVPALFDSLMSRGDKGTLVETATGIHVTSFLLSYNVQRLLYLPSRWPGVADTLKDLDAGTVGATDFPVTSPVPQDTLPAFCQDWSDEFTSGSFRQFDQTIKAEEKVAPHVRFGAEGTADFSFCAGWKGVVPNPQEALDAHTSNPVLVLGTLHDTATPYTWSVNIAHELGPDGKLVTYLGAGHGAYRQHNPCPESAVDQALINLKYPAPGATCASVDPPLPTA